MTRPSFSSYPQPFSLPLTHFSFIYCRLRPQIMYLCASMSPLPWGSLIYIHYVETELYVISPPPFLMENMTLKVATAVKPATLSLNYCRKEESSSWHLRGAGRTTGAKTEKTLCFVTHSSIDYSLLPSVGTKNNCSKKAGRGHVEKEVSK